ncbi:L-threonine 3-dehydrogenase [Candidatus Rubidus massiliensis]|nr:MAG: L-threonine 3-dehydrogenase [Chlamydia sp. 32-24]CDZ81699.1 L-threonine 3-dehydrogenase [Candidatus Rubidus massiliensis]
MKALVKKYSKPGLWMDEVPVPEVGDDEVLIKVKKTSICGTDVHIYKWDSWAQKTIPVPMVVGHEFMGTIEALGKNVKHLQVGQRVSGEGHITCGQCPPCKMGNKHLCMNTLGVGVNRHGCFAEYFNLPAENVFLLPDSVKDNVASIFDPYGNAVHTTLSFEVTGEDVLITGAGPIGIMAAAIAQKAGARHVVITDVNEYRLDLAKKMGATTTVNVAKQDIKEVMKELGITHGFTVGLEMSGHPNGLSTLLETAQHGAKIALLGILPPHTTVDWDLVIFKMLMVKGIYGREVFRTWYKMTNLLESGLNLEPIITHHFPIDDYEKGFEVMLSGKSGKVILDW